jgi:hypothetical protein
VNVPIILSFFPFIYTLLGRNVLSGALFLHIINRLSLDSETKFSAVYNRSQHYSFVYLSIYFFSIGVKKIQDIELNGNKHCPNLIYSLLLRKGI